MNNPRTETVKCNICQSDTYETIIKNGDENFPVNLVVCDRCGLAYLNPRWNKASYSNYYKSAYDQTYRLNQLDSSGILNPNITNPIVERIIENDLLQNETVKILEIGSGNGQNLIDLKRIFPEARLYAIEPSLASQKILINNGIDLLADDIDKTWENDFNQYFDLIIMRHVLEHFLDPGSVLKKVHYSLNDSGIVYIAVPDNLLKTRQEGWLRIAHTYYFNTNSLSNLLIKEHFEPLLLSKDHRNETEIFNFSKKAQVDRPLEISQSYYQQQSSIFKTVIRNERSVLIRIKKKIIKIIKRIKNTFVKADK